MAFIIEENGNISLIQGDSVDIPLEEIPTDKTYNIYLGIQNSKRQPMIEELQTTNLSGETRLDVVIFHLSGSVTDKLTVPLNKEYETYYYAVKLCTTTTEDTVSLGNEDITIHNTITVYPKRVEGN